MNIQPKRGAMVPRRNSEGERPGQATICIFVKPPVPGEVKTRLIPALGAVGAASLAGAFFQDVVLSLIGLPWACPVIASTAPFSTPVSCPYEMWLQGEGDLGVRLERILQRALLRSAPTIAIGADSPGLPMRFLDDARLKLRRADAVLGPSDDGGFYLIGINRCPLGLLREIPWSQSDTFACTLARLKQHGLNTQVLDPWFDVDTPQDLARLKTLILRGQIRAPRTAAAIRCYSMNGKRRNRSTSGQ